MTHARFTVYKDSDLFDFINAPVGKGLPITEKLRPLIAGETIAKPDGRRLRSLSLAVPTTAGTGSETTGTAILDIPSRNFKTGIANRALKPMLVCCDLALTVSMLMTVFQGIVDTLNTDTCPTAVHISSGLDVLFHSMESYTAIP